MQDNADPVERCFCGHPLAVHGDDGCHPTYPPGIEQFMKPCPCKGYRPNYEDMKKRKRDLDRIVQQMDLDRDRPQHNART